jgi:hypothetical protein
MIELYYWPTPNGHKITMFLEAADLAYHIHPVDISAGDQFKPEFLAFSPNNRVPAITDTEPEDGGEPVTVFESAGAWRGAVQPADRYLVLARDDRRPATDRAAGDGGAEREQCPEDGWESVLCPGAVVGSLTRDRQASTPKAPAESVGIIVIGALPAAVPTSEC